MKPNEALSSTTGEALLLRLAPGSHFESIQLLPGSYSNSTHVVEGRAVDGHPLRFAIRRYAEFGGYDLGQKAQREFGTLRLLNEHGLPVPQPLLLDADGSLLGYPGIVTAFVEGEMMEELTDPLTCAGEMARLLARIHAVPCIKSSVPFLLDAKAEALWFMQKGKELPDELRGFPHGEAIWHGLLEMLPEVKTVSPALVHLDYWAGNLLWRDGRISSVVDFEEAALGDPAIDVAYCRMDLAIRGLPAAAEHFLRVYEEISGSMVENLRFWELAAAMRPLSTPEGWISDSPARENFIAWLDRS